jgi:hypothetical protein
VKSTRLFKQALLVTAVSSLVLSSAFAMEDSWNNAVEEKNSMKLQQLCVEGLKDSENNSSEEKKWSDRIEKLSKVLFDKNMEINFSELRDDSPSIQSPLPSNNNLPKLEENLKENQPEIQPQIFVLDDKKNDIITVLPQKTSKDLWMEDSINDPTKRFDFVINVLWSLYEKGLLPPVAEMKKKVTSSFTLDNVKVTVDLTDLNKGISKLVGKDQYMYKKAIEEIDRVFNKSKNLNIEKLPSPISTKGNKQVAKAWSENYELERRHNWSTLSSYYLKLGHPTNGVIKKILNKIDANEIEYK